MWQTPCSSGQEEPHCEGGCPARSWAFRARQRDAAFTLRAAGHSPGPDRVSPNEMWLLLTVADRPPAALTGQPTLDSVV